MSDLKSGAEYEESSDMAFPSGSRAEGIALENCWGHPEADEDIMWLEGGPMGVYVPRGLQARGNSCLTYRPEGCPPAYTKLEISQLSSLKEYIAEWWMESCVHEADGRLWLDTFNTVRAVNRSCVATVSGPAAQVADDDMVCALVCSSPDPDFEQDFRHRPRGEWPPTSLINYILQLPMMLVLVGHRLSPEFRLQARLSWSHYELTLIQELSENIRQGYIACKYVLKRFLAARRGKNEVCDGRSHVGSFHVKMTFLHFLEKRPPSLITSPAQLYLDLLHELDEYIKAGKLPHYFFLQCDLLVTVEEGERQLVRQTIRDILSDPLKALLTSPTVPQEIYGEVNPDELVTAFHRVSDHPTCKQAEEGLFDLLARVDERRRQRYRMQRERDVAKQYDILSVSDRAQLTSLVDMAKEVNVI